MLYRVVSNVSPASDDPSTDKPKAETKDKEKDKDKDNAPLSEADKAIAAASSGGGSGEGAITYLQVMSVAVTPDKIRDSDTKNTA